MTVTVLHAGLLTTIQDLGRYGAQKYGVIVSGAMDSYSLRIANLLVGNEEGEGAIEVTLFGTSLQFEKDQLIAITGGDLAASLDGEKAPMWRPILVRNGSTLTFKSGTKGARSYIAFAGGIEIPPAMGSKSTYLRAGIGGFQGRALQKGDTFNCGEMSPLGQSFFYELKARRQHFTWSVNYQPLLNLQQTQTIRVLEGTEFNRFDKPSQQLLFTETFTITKQADRMGYRLEGTTPLTLIEEFELLSEGVTYGTIQVPTNGQPIILMADRQTTGGYPKIGQVISADLSNLAQLQPTATMQFKKVSLEQAQTELIKNEQLIKDIKRGIRYKSK
ncbi:biotin-dependent carboxyltransferase [Sporosarcina sp. Marseille-Q4063]|uniref:5-oxoprolinase subunit C family protein n=1 Tax=Sporosarcina sp. Marseille-Q4063 TaxID=2810514 RepID=UPI001BAF3994|nr:biotin-dependent carboxyltransferase family protein [Sporosarcina sp. Marseille-Q4063]QUW21373.1 biotin-dependent carboxyltransferase [Sporosarcina sp. Marseille-Q4063]